MLGGGCEEIEISRPSSDSEFFERLGWLLAKGFKITNSSGSGSGNGRGSGSGSGSGSSSGSSSGSGCGRVLESSLLQKSSHIHILF